jgi:hypothetical protein
VAVAYRGSRDGVSLAVDTAGDAGLRFEIAGDGSWAFRQGSWADEYGREHRTGLLRPTLRGIARASRPDHDTVLSGLVRDVEQAAGSLISLAEEHRRRATEPARPPGPEELLARNWPTLSAADRETLWRMTGLLDVQAGCTLMVRDERGHDVLFLLDGVLEVDTGRRAVYLAPGSVVGEIAALGNGVRTATVETVTDCLLLSASGADVTALPEAVFRQLDRKVLA